MEWDFEKGAELVPGRSVVRLLGGGERYETYLAWDDTLLALVVVKILRPHLVDDRHALRGLAEEVRLLELLSHPVIVRSFDAELDGPRPYVVLEHLEGPRLSTLVRRFGPVEREQLLPLGLQLCSALHYLAGRGIVHLDVKPSNIIMGAPARLIDLSIARPVEELAGNRHRLGTDAYMAPEQCDPSRFGEIGPLTDVWGLGVTLYEALAGVRPFADGDETADALAARYPQVASGAPPLSPEVPVELARIVQSCLRDDPGSRPWPSDIAAALERHAALLPLPRLGRFRPGARPSHPPAPAR